MICSRTLADEAQIVYDSGKEFVYDHMMQSTMVPFKKDTDTRLNITVLLWSHMSGYRDSKKYIFPSFTQVSVTINGLHNMLFTNGIKSKNMGRGQVPLSKGKTKLSSEI